MVRLSLLHGGNMYLIVGLGNPGDKYAGTRHNMGFDTIDVLADKYFISVSQKEKRALVGKGMIEGNKVILVKPQTFMNLSGESVGPLADYYGCAPEEIIVIYDDICLEPGQLRVRGKGSAGGHNGMKSLISHLGTQEFPRVRVGVGAKPPKMDLADFVLSHFPKDQQDAAKEGVQQAAEAVREILVSGLERAQNLYNGKKKEPVE